ncbi:MAG: hypothetical protein AVO35_13115 [Candidatus Aegiribacteria sp. MLS_C]|nr:MAG: hypothetical protein AVO35_13115 [Candidatus Aegiribacteria sp. MLS_C]
MKSLYAAALFLMILSGSSSAQWISLGPAGGTVRNIIQDPLYPDTFYAFTDSLPTRVLMSGDGGNSWTEAGSFDGRENCAAMGTNGVLYVGCDYTLGSSTDGGATWSFLPAGNNLWYSIVPDQDHPDTVYAAGTTFTTNWVMGFMKSEDAGQTWTYKAIGSPISYGECLGVSPASYDTLFIAGYNGTTYVPLLYRSTNGGVNWSNVTPSGASTDYYAYSVAVNPSIASRVVFASTHQIFRSTDTGGSWTLASNEMSGNFRMAWSSNNTDLLLSACIGGLWHSTDEGQTWSAAYGTWPSSIKITDAIYDWSDPDIAYAGCVRSLQSSTDGGTNWVDDTSGLSLGRIASVHVCPARPTDVYVGLREWGIYRSEDSGNSWTLLPTPNPTTRVHYNSIASSPADADLVLAIDGTYNPGCIIRSTDGGDSWNWVVNRFMIAQEIMFDPLDPTVCWSGGTIYSGGGVMAVGKSINAGLNWTWTNVSTTGYYMEELALDPQHPDTVYLCGGFSNYSGIWRTVDGGASWAKIPSTDIPGTIYSLVVSPWDPQTIYAASKVGIYRSTDFAASWTKLSTEIGSCRDILLDPSSPSTMLVGTESQGLYWSEDGGTTWSNESAGMTDPSVYHLAVNPSLYYFAGTDGASVYRWTIPVGVAQQETASFPSAGLRVAPNPVSGSGTVISYEVTMNAAVEIAVYDLQGRVVASMDEGMRSPGTCEFMWNPSGSSGSPLPPGVYVIRITAGESVGTARVVVAR